MQLSKKKNLRRNHRYSPLCGRASYR